MKLRLLLFSLLVLSFFASFGQDRIYWGDQNLDKIGIVNASDLGSESTISSIQNPNGLAYFHANPTYPLFFAVSNAIDRNDLAGNTNSILTTTGQFNRGVAIDYLNKKIYWSNLVDGYIARANLDGSGKELDFITGLNSPSDVEIDPINEKIYWSEDRTGGAIRRANLTDGGNIQMLVDNVDAIGVAVDPLRNKIYYTKFPDGTVSGANLDGSGVTTISGVSAIADIDVDVATGVLYMVSYGTKVLTKANPDGTNKITATADGLFITYADVTTPVMSSIVRRTPTATTLGQNATATFRVTFSEPVLNFDVTDLELDSPVEGTVTVTPVNLNTTYDVRIENISGTGTLGLGLAANQDIVDFRGNLFTGTITTEQSYTVISAPMPFITAFDPATGPVNGVVTISGTGFSTTPGDNTVTFNGIIAPVTGSTATTITTAVPPGAADGPIVVTVNGLEATSENNFIICVPPPKPTITRVGNVLTSSAAEGNLWFYEYNEIAGATGTSYTALQPGEYMVKVTEGGCSANSDPTAITGEILTPVISGFTPDSGTPGTEVVITGVTFGATTGENVVKFNGVAAEITANSSTSITAKVPAGAGSGPISVTYNTRTGTSTNNFTYVCIPPAKPTITHEGGLLTSSSSSNNQWLRNGADIAGATSQTYTATEAGAYSVRVTADGCSTESDPTTLVGVEEKFAPSVGIYPNPTEDVLRVEVPSHCARSTVDIYTTTGLLKQSTVMSSAKEEIDVRSYAEGMYIIRMTTSDGIVTKKFQKQNLKQSAR